MKNYRKPTFFILLTLFGVLSLVVRMVYALDTIQPTVTINQATTQIDPEFSGNQTKFTIVFSEPIATSSLTTSQIDLSASTVPTKSVATITQAAPFNNTVFEVLVNSTGEGTVNAKLKTQYSSTGLNLTGLYSNSRRIAGDDEGNVFISTNFNYIVKVNASNTIVADYSGMIGPHDGMTVDSSGTVYAVGNNGVAAPVMYKIATSGVVSTFFTFGFGDAPRNIEIDSLGNLYTILSAQGVMKIAPSGTSSLFFSLGFNNQAMVLDSLDNVFVVKENGTIQKITPAGVISTFATISGTTLSVSIARDSSNNLYVADRETKIISKITPTGVVSTLATLPNRIANIKVDIFGNVFANAENFSYLVDQGGNIKQIGGGSIVGHLHINPAGNKVWFTNNNTTPGLITLSYSSYRDAAGNTGTDSSSTDNTVTMYDQNKADFRLIYNSVTRKYEVYIKPRFSGPAASTFGSRLTVVFPESVDNNIITNLTPATTSGVSSLTLFNDNKFYAPAEDGNNDYYKIDINYGTMAYATDTEKLVGTFELVGPTKCIASARLHSNPLHVSSIFDALTFTNVDLNGSFAAPGRSYGKIYGNPIDDLSCNLGVTIEQAAAQPDPTATNTILFTTTFSEAIDPASISASSFLLGGTGTGSVSTPTTSDNITWIVSINALTTGTFILNMASSSVISQVGSLPNKASLSVDNTVTYGLETTAPTVTINQVITQSDPTATSSIEYDAVFSEPIASSTFACSDVSVVNGSCLTISFVSGNTYSVNVNATAAGVVTVTIPAGGIQDLAGNLNTASTFADNNVTYDNVQPGVTVDLAAGQASPATTTPIFFTTVFSESIATTTFTCADISIVNGTCGSIFFVSGSTYTINIIPASPGSVIVTIPAGGIQDLAGNTNSISTSTINNVNYTGAPAPVLAILTPPTSPSTTATPSFTFTSTASGTISFSGGCGSATTAASVATNTITLSSLGNGTYSSCSIIVTSALGVVSAPLAIPSFTVNVSTPSGGGGGGSGGGGSLVSIPSVGIAFSSCTTTSKTAYVQSQRNGDQDNVTRADMNDDGKIGILDFNSLVVNYNNKTDVSKFTDKLNKCKNTNISDVSCDGLVNVLDFNSLLVNWNITVGTSQIATFDSTSHNLASGCNANTLSISTIKASTTIGQLPSSAVFSQVIATSTPVSSSQMSCPYITKEIKLGSINDRDQVKRLQIYLNSRQGENLVLDGEYKLTDVEAVKRFQLKYKSVVLTPWGLSEPSGWVFNSTINKINQLVCTRN